MHKVINRTVQLPVPIGAFPTRRHRESSAKVESATRADQAIHLVAQSPIADVFSLSDHVGASVHAANIRRTQAVVKPRSLVDNNMTQCRKLDAV